MFTLIKKGEIYLTDLNPTQGSEQGGIRPCVVISNNIGNKHSPTVIVAMVTSKVDKLKLPTHVEILPYTTQLREHSLILAEQIRTIDKLRLKQKIGELDSRLLSKLNFALRVSLELT
ncbi:MAG: type II toxin-antitoxin system PemK/MazF family toxin [Firmicutes bacterium]|nr:type II toxin-antitoxin system PemK/MazF family toxin [Bacillota bacterium]MCL2770970.1 type II toxin-antitoxin system PemK/MazF family toxin [Bacillota bacterium]